jgi:hypothetical protein
MTAASAADDRRGRQGMTAAIDRFAIALGRGLVAGAAATAAMTVSSTLEMKLRGREPSTAPADVAARLLRVRPLEPGGAGVFATTAHLSMGVTLGSVRSVIDLAGLSGPRAAAIWLGATWTPDLVMVPALGAADPPWRWGAVETALSGLHHLVYATVGEIAYRALSDA